MTKELGGQTRHDMMAETDHDSYSRERFVQEYVWQINGAYHQGNYALYDKKIRPKDGRKMRVQDQRKAMPFRQGDEGSCTLDGVGLALDYIESRNECQRGSVADGNVADLHLVPPRL